MGRQGEGGSGRRRSAHPLLSVLYVLSVLSHSCSYLDVGVRHGEGGIPASVPLLGHVPLHVQAHVRVVRRAVVARVASVPVVLVVRVVGGRRTLKAVVGGPGLAPLAALAALAALARSALGAAATGPPGLPLGAGAPSRAAPQGVALLRARLDLGGLGRRFGEELHR